MKINTGISAAQAAWISKPSLENASRELLGDLEVSRYASLEPADRVVLGLPGDNYLEMRAAATSQLQALEKASQRCRKVQEQDPRMAIFSGGVAGTFLGAALSLDGSGAFLGGIVGVVAGAALGLTVNSLGAAGENQLQHRSETKRQQLQRLDVLAEEVHRSPGLIPGGPSAMLEALVDEKIRLGASHWPSQELEQLSLPQLFQVAEERAQEVLGELRD